MASSFALQEGRGSFSGGRFSSVAMSVECRTEIAACHRHGSLSVMAQISEIHPPAKHGLGRVCWGKQAVVVNVSAPGTRPLRRSGRVPRLPCLISTASDPPQLADAIPTLCHITSQEAIRRSSAPRALRDLARPRHMRTPQVCALGHSPFPHRLHLSAPVHKHTTLLDAPLRIVRALDWPFPLRPNRYSPGLENAWATPGSCTSYQYTHTYIYIYLRTQTVTKV